ncbi:MAG: hypothetical protein Q6K08_07200, partial [Thermostichales cyanobacterium GMQP_bins_62]
DAKRDLELRLYTLQNHPPTPQPAPPLEAAIPPFSVDATVPPWPPRPTPTAQPPATSPARARVELPAFVRRR